jgi:hypothetical protein
MTTNSHAFIAFCACLWTLSCYMIGDTLGERFREGRINSALFLGLLFTIMGIILFYNIGT